MEKIDTEHAQLHNCTNHIPIPILESFKSQKACSIECNGHTCHSPPATDYDTTFTAVIIFQDVLKQKAIE